MWLSILGMYEHDPDLFKGFNVPVGVDRDSVINNILLNCAELELLYPELETMKLAITVWSLSNQKTWEKLYNTMTLDYNPIWNVDADIKQQRDIDRDLDQSGSGSGNNTHSVQGFNSSSWAAADKDDSSFDNKQHTDEITGETFTERRTGNIGVTATQDLIKKEREIADFNIIDFITESFKNRFCLMVY